MLDSTTTQGSDAGKILFSVKVEGRSKKGEDILVALSKLFNDCNPANALEIVIVGVALLRERADKGLGLGLGLNRDSVSSESAVVDAVSTLRVGKVVLTGSKKRSSFLTVDVSAVSSCAFPSERGIGFRLTDVLSNALVNTRGFRPLSSTRFRALIPTQ